MKKFSRFYCRVIHLIEDVLPSILLLIMLLSFLIGIVYRYLFRNPQPWTYEMNSICFLSISVLSCGAAHRCNDHVVFDMIYSRRSPRSQCIMRLISNFVTLIVALLMIPASFTYLMAMSGLLTQVVKMPKMLVFVCFPVMFALTVFRCGHRFFRDIKAIREKTYLEDYWDEEVAQE